MTLFVMSLSFSSLLFSYGVSAISVHFLAMIKRIFCGWRLTDHTSFLCGFKLLFSSVVSFCDVRRHCLGRRGHTCASPEVVKFEQFTLLNRKY